MATVNVKILEEADSFAFLTPEEARLNLQMPEGDPSDAFLSAQIDQNSDMISRFCNRVFARQRVRETWRCLGDPCDCADAASTRRLFLTHWPVKEEDIERVECAGAVLASSAWELEEESGTLVVFTTTEPVVVTYTGGYELPDEAPPSLKYAAALLVQSAKSAIERESIVGAGIRSISHKEARVMYHTPSASESTATAKSGSTPSLDSVKGLLNHFRRSWI